MSRVPRITGVEMGRYVRERRPFTNSKGSAYGRWENDHLYVAYSYGAHFPMYAYDSRADIWIANEDKYSTTTGRHKSHAHPGRVDMYCDTATLKEIIRGGGTAEIVRAMVAKAAGTQP